MAGNRLFPEKLARIYVEAHKYHPGILNRLFLHRDQIRIQDVSNLANRQPFLIDTVG